MEYFYIIGICIIIILITFFILRAHFKRIYKKNLSLSEIQNQIVNRTKQISEIQSQIKESEQKLNNINSSISLKESTLTSLNNIIQEKTQFNSTLQQIREEELDKLIEKEKEKRFLQLNKEIEEWSESAQEVANERYLYIKQEYDNILLSQKEELQCISNEIEKYRTQREAINREILRSRALNEQQDFYRIQISPEAQHDINIINSIRPQIYKFETLNKLLYDNYISKPTKEMAKRVLQGKDPSGIYKVTNIQTKEVYIGKSTAVASRWVSHVKAAQGLDGVADSQFQRALRQYGIDNFTWELLEEVPKDKLTEKEKYYITFYDTTHYGYNMKVG